MKNQKGFSLIELLIVVAIIGIIAAIAIPSLLRARMSANESAAIGDGKSVMSGNATYASRNRQCYATTMALLAQPLAYMGTASFIDSQLGGLVAKNGYNHGYGSDPGAVPPCCATGIPPVACGDPGGAGYAYQSNPTGPGSTGTRSFTIDNSGVTCEQNSPAVFPLGDTSNPAGCQPISS